MSLWSIGQSSRSHWNHLLCFLLLMMHLLQITFENIWKKKEVALNVKFLLLLQHFLTLFNNYIFIYSDFPYFCSDQLSATYYLEKVQMTFANKINTLFKTEFCHFISKLLFIFRFQIAY